VERFIAEFSRAFFAVFCVLMLVAACLTAVSIAAGADVF
jgi:hypothetical protein